MVALEHGQVASAGDHLLELVDQLLHAVWVLLASPETLVACAGLHLRGCKGSCVTAARLRAAGELCCVFAGPNIPSTLAELLLLLILLAPAANILANCRSAEILILLGL